jgi:hypothetical protein
MEEFKLIVQEDGRVLPEDPVAANRFPPDREPVNEDPGPVPSADRRMGDPNVVETEAAVRPRGRPPLRRS